MTGKIAYHNMMMFLSALFGSIIAIGQRTTWQDPVETAQVLAGLVNYPADNPFNAFHVKVWSLINQITALILSAGVPEIITSHLIAGTVGAISFMGIFLITSAVSGNPLVGLMTPLLMYSLSLVGASSAYPIALLGSPSSYGIIGLSYTLLVIGLLGTERYGTGAFLAALAPAIHPGMGTFCVGIATISVLANSRKLRPNLYRIGLFFAAGAVITVTSLVWQINYASHLPGLDPSLKKTYIDAYIKNFDFHRTAGNWNQPGVLFGIMLSAISLLLLRKKELQPGSRIIFTSIIVSVATTFILVIASDFVPFLAFLKVLIPWRFMNYANICILPIAFGLFSFDHTKSEGTPYLLFIALIFSCFSIRLLKLPAENILFFFALLAILFMLPVKSLYLPEKTFKILGYSRTALLISVTALLVFRQVVPGAVNMVSGNLRLQDRTNTEIYRIASQRQGVLLTAGGMHLVQLVTRRAVLLDGGALDMFPYIPETGPSFNRILRKMYGLDLFVAPPEEVRNRATIPFSHRNLWESWRRDEWCAALKEFGVTDVITPEIWRLNLPVLAQGEELILYGIAEVCGQQVTTVR